AVLYPSGAPVPYSTVLGTSKKFCSVSGALATMRSAILPSVTSSLRIFIAIGMTEVIGSTPETSTSDSCSTKPRMTFSSPVIRSASSSVTASRASRATRLTVATSTDTIFSRQISPARYKGAWQAVQWLSDADPTGSEGHRAADLGHFDTGAAPLHAGDESVRRLV